MPNALLVGGCTAPYHRMEPAAPPLREALESLGLTVEIDGIRHPDGGDAWTGGYSALTADSLSRRDLVVLYTTGRDRHGADVGALIRWVEAGGALVGIHCATDSFTDDPEFVAFMGGRFRMHPSQLEISLEVVDSRHPIMHGIEPFTVFDELYLFADYDPDRVHLLAQTRSYADDGPVPIAWTREPGSGRLFYLSTGHNPSTMEDPRWQALFKRGVEWALGRS